MIGPHCRGSYVIQQSDLLVKLGCLGQEIIDPIGAVGCADQLADGIVSSDESPAPIQPLNQLISRSIDLSQRVLELVELDQEQAVHRNAGNSVVDVIL